VFPNFPSCGDSSGVSATDPGSSQGLRDNDPAFRPDPKFKRLAHQYLPNSRMTRGEERSPYACFPLGPRYIVDIIDDGAHWFLAPFTLRDTIVEGTGGAASVRMAGSKINPPAIWIFSRPS